MRNPYNGTWYVAVSKDDSKMICITWSVNGTCRAWEGYSDECIGVAGGYGYDKTSHVLVQAIRKLFGVDVEGSMAGDMAVIASCKNKGIYLDRMDYLAYYAINVAKGYTGGDRVEAIKETINKND